MAQPLMALGVNTPDINTVGNYLGAQKAATDQKSAQINQLTAQQQQEAASLEHIAQMGFGVMGGKLDGPIDPKRLDTMITLLGSNPLAAKLKENPDLLRTITAGSANVVAQAQNNEQFEMAKKTFQMQLDQFNRPVFKTPGEIAFDPKTGQPMDGQGSPGFFGTSTDQQAMQILANGDPSTYEYAQAYNQQSQPVISMQSDGHGGMVQVATPRTLPQGTRPPTYSGAQGPAGATAPGPVAAAPGADVGAPDAGIAPSVSANGTTVTQVPGLTKDPTETQLRYRTITKILDGEIPTIQKNFKALSDPLSQAAGLLPGDAGRALQKPEYKQAFDSVTASIANILYALSGASSNPGEVQKQAQVLMPHFGDDPETQRNAFNRIKTYIEATAEGTNDPNVIAKTKAALDGMDFGTAGGDGAPKVKVGAIEDGYRFKGGDPGDQRNWTEVNSSGSPDQRSGMN